MSAFVCCMSLFDVRCLLLLAVVYCCSLLLVAVRCYRLALLMLMVVYCLVLAVGG